MGVVYAAEDERDSSRLVALKVVSQQSQDRSADAARRFVREAKILESLRHPNIVSFYEVGVFQEQSFFAMELLSGASLKTYFKRPWSELVPLFVQICQGMEYLASRNIVHRDLSPDNVLVVVDGDRRIPKILDFGIAKDTAREETIHNFTQTGMLMGKPQYWSPEQIQAQEGGHIDWRSDVYAMGVIFYQVLSGDLPFQGDAPAIFITKHLFEPPAPLRGPAGAPPLPRAIVGIVHRMLEKNRELRPAYAEVIEVFRHTLEQGVDEAELMEPADYEPTITGTVTTDLESAIAKAARTDATAQGRTNPTRTSATKIVEPKTAATASWEQETVRGTPTGPTALSPVTSTRTRPTVVGTDATKILPGQDATSFTREGAVARDETLGAAAPARSRMTVPVVVGAAAVVLVVGFVAVRSGVFSPDVPEVRPTAVPVATAPVAAGTGTLRLDAFPWARVLAVVEEKTGRTVSLPDGASTPLVLPLEPGLYSIDLESGVDRKAQRVQVEVGRGESVARTVTLATPERVVALLD